MQTDYPKVLIVGKYFNKKSGDKTLTNLFKGWDKSRIAVACENIDYPDFDICDKYYNIGSPELKHNFPFNLNEPWKPKVFSGVLPVDRKKNIDTQIIAPTNRNKFQSIYHNLLLTTGLNYYKRRLKISKRFLKWVREFSPDIIYSQLADLELILFVECLHDKLKIPIAIHIMDDWPATIGREGVLKSYWHRRIINSFRKLLDNTSVHLSISEAMAEEYQLRYGHKFTTFHNPVDVDFWGKASKSNYERNDPFVILYAGRIGRGIRNGLVDIAKAVEDLFSQGVNIEFQIQATRYDSVLEELSKYSCVKLNEMIAYDELPEIFGQVDVLLIPIDFEEDAINFLKYSMLTKASEYMVSGTPVLLYASSETAMARHALKYGWAYIVSEKNDKLIKDAISELYQSVSIRRELGNNAKEFAKKHYEGHVVRERFREILDLQKKGSMIRNQVCQ